MLPIGVGAGDRFSEFPVENKLVCILGSVRACSTPKSWGNQVPLEGVHIAYSAKAFIVC